MVLLSVPLLSCNVYLPSPISFNRSPTLLLPPTEIPWLLLGSYLCILLQIEVMSASIEALCSVILPPVVSTNLRVECGQVMFFFFKDLHLIVEIFNFHSNSSLHVQFIYNYYYIYYNYYIYNTRVLEDHCLISPK